MTLVKALIDEALRAYVRRKPALCASQRRAQPSKNLWAAFLNLTRRKSRFPVLTPAARLGGPRLALEHLAGGAVTTIPRGSFDDRQLMRPGVARSARA